MITLLEVAFHIRDRDSRKSYWRVPWHTLTKECQEMLLRRARREIFIQKIKDSARSVLRGISRFF